MKFFLFSPSPETFTFTPSFLKKTRIKHCAKINILQNSEKFEPHHELYKRMKHHLYDSSPQQDWIINLEFSFYDQEEPKLDIALEGELLKTLHDIFYRGSIIECLQLSIQAIVSRGSRNSGSSAYFRNPESITASSKPIENDVIYHTNVASRSTDITNPTSKIEMHEDTSEGLGNHFRYVQKGIVLPQTRPSTMSIVWGSSIPLEWKISVELRVDDYVDLTELLPRMSETNSKIFEEKLFCDFEIVSCDGFSVPCNKAILSASSDMFRAKCEGKLNEPMKNQMTIDMSAEGVNALLEFIYCGEVQKPMVKSLVAFELFEAGHQYGIAGLEKVMVGMFLQKSNKWYTTDVAFDLLRFMVNYEGESKSALAGKAIEALAVKSDELRNCVSMKEAFAEFPLLAVQMFPMLVQDIKSRLE